MITSAKIIGEGIAYEVYARQEPDVKRGHKEFIMSRSELTNFASNPKRWLDGYKADDDGDTAATIWGSLIECLAGLNGNFDDKYAVAPAEYEDEKTGKMKPWTFAANVCKAWKEEQGDREIIKSDVMAKAKLAVAALRADREVSELFDTSQKQVMVAGIWKDNLTSLEIPIRCLIDLVPAPGPFGMSLADFKTARNGNPDIWPRVCDDAGYDVQAALSIDLYTTATGGDRQGWIMPVQENVHPYHVVTPIPALTIEFLAYGRIKYQSALTYYAKCLSESKWPSYSTGNRLVFAGLQFVGPEMLWQYRETAGHGHLSDFEPERRKPVAEQSDSADITP